MARSIGRIAWHGNDDLPRGVTGLAEPMPRRGRVALPPGRTSAGTDGPARRGRDRRQVSYGVGVIQPSAAPTGSLRIAIRPTPGRSKIRRGRLGARRCGFSDPRIDVVDRQIGEPLRRKALEFRPVHAEDARDSVSPCPCTPSRCRAPSACLGARGGAGPGQRRLLAEVAVELLPWVAAAGRAVELIDRAVRINPTTNFCWAQR